MKAASRSTIDEVRDRLPAAWAEPRPTRRASRSRAQRQIVPPHSVAGRALTIVVAIMSFLASITVGAVTLVSDASRDWQNDIAREVTIQVRPLEGVDTRAETEAAAAIARSMPGVAGARVLADAENAHLLEPWLGSDLSIEELPLPRLIVVEIADPAALDLDALGTRLTAEVQGASLDDHRAWTERLRTMASATVAVGVSVLLLVLTATALCVVFATRGAMAGNRDIVSVLHFVGAEDRFIAGEFQRHFLLLGLKGGLVGAFGAAILFALLSYVSTHWLNSAESDQVASLFGQFAVGPTGYFGALAVAFIIAIMTAVTSRLTVHRYLASAE